MDFNFILSKKANRGEIKYLLTLIKLFEPSDLGVSQLKKQSAVTAVLDLVHTYQFLEPKVKTKIAEKMH